MHVSQGPLGIGRPFEAVLVANRGEIALRVIRACREAGLRSVAIHTDLDTTALHTRAADDAVRVDSYLDIDQVVAAALATGAQAVHPGYGFLSERAAFAAAVERAGLVLVGPPSSVIEQMGRKDAAREVALAAGVPVVPSAELPGRSDGRSAHPAAGRTAGVTDGPGATVDGPGGRREAPDGFGALGSADSAAGSPKATPAGGPDDLGYPLLVKATAGGGGKGMRVVRGPEELEDAVAAAGREALAAFGDDTLLLERYVERGRHIEVQVLADTHGHVVHLFERDCSTQRRHQKVVEEAPAPTISEEVRAQVLRDAVALAEQVGYVGAGTVEFLLDSDSGEAYFLEMNTRLQVEHPVTEGVVRVAGAPLDLVRLQLLVARGDPLPFTQDEVTVEGHAIEARVYAEDPYAGFLPQAGTADLVRWPEGARVDHALESGQVVSTAYDPMLGKVIVHGPDRESARRALVAALDDTAVLGLTTNVGFLRSLVAGDAFRDATIDTAWLDRTSLEPPADDLARVFAAWIQAMLVAETGPPHPFQPDGWRLAGPSAPVRVELDRPVLVDRTTGLVTVLDPATGGAVEAHVRQVSAERHVAVLIVDGRRERAVVNAQGDVVEVVHHGQRHVFRPDVRTARAAEAGDGAVTAPMPGTLLSVAVTEGQPVVPGEVLGVLEAMKMELALTAPVSGTVAEVRAAAGDQVPLGATVFVVAPTATPAAPELSERRSATADSRSDNSGQGTGRGESR